MGLRAWIKGQSHTARVAILTGVITGVFGIITTIGGIVATYFLTRPNPKGQMKLSEVSNNLYRQLPAKFKDKDGKEQEIDPKEYSELFSFVFENPTGQTIKGLVVAFPRKGFAAITAEKSNSGSLYFDKRIDVNPVAPQEKVVIYCWYKEPLKEGDKITYSTDDADPKEVCICVPGCPWYRSWWFLGSALGLAVVCYWGGSVLRWCFPKEAKKEEAKERRRRDRNKKDKEKEEQATAPPESQTQPDGPPKEGV